MFQNQSELIVVICDFKIFRWYYKNILFILTYKNNWRTYFWNPQFEYQQGFIPFDQFEKFLYPFSFPNFPSTDEPIEATKDLNKSCSNRLIPRLLNPPPIKSFSRPRFLPPFFPSEMIRNDFAPLCWNRSIYFINTLCDDSVSCILAWNGIVLVHARGSVVGREAVGLVEVYYQRYGGGDPAVAIICL